MQRRGNVSGKYKVKFHPSEKIISTAWLQWVPSGLQRSLGRGSQAIKPWSSCTSRVFYGFCSFVCRRSTGTETKSSTSLTPPSWETSVAWVFEVVFSFSVIHLWIEALSANGEISQMGFMHGLGCLPVLGPPWEGLHFSLKGRRRRSPKLLACPSVIQRCCPVASPASPASPVMHRGWQGRAEWHPRSLCSSSHPFFPSVLCSPASPPHSLVLSQAPHIAYVTITKSTRIAAAIAWHGYI